MTYPELLRVLKDGMRARRMSWYSAYELRLDAEGTVRLYDTRLPRDAVGLPWRQSGYDYHADDYHLIPQ